MTSLTGQPAGAEPVRDRAANRAKGEPLLDLTGIDLTSLVHDRAYLEQFIPHRGDMFLLDGIIWESENLKQGVGLWKVRRDSFWAAGHFPGRPILPGVLMVEAGAQLACYLYNARSSIPHVVLFLRIENAAFRSAVEPGDTLHILCNETKCGRRTFSCEMQGWVGDRIAFDATITGMRADAPE